MNDFPLAPVDSMAGLASFLFIEAYGVETIPYPVNHVISSAITLKSGFAWKKGYTAYDNLSYKEEPTETDHGIAFKLTINGFAPDSEEMSQLINLMQGHFFIVQVTDNDGRLRLVGTLEHPLQFSSMLDTQTLTGVKGNNFTFSGMVKSKPPILKFT